MARFIFLTHEGYTYQPDNDGEIIDIENLQVIGYGYGYGENAKEAFDDLMKECEYLKKTSFVEIFAQQMADKERVEYFQIQHKKSFVTA